MPETPPNRNEPVSAAVQRRIRWDAVAAIIAALIGLLALLVSGYTAYVQRQQVRAQVWPHLELFDSNGLPTDAIKDNVFVSHGGTLLMMNKGVGPAIVQNVEVLVDGKPQPDWPHVFKALGFRPGLPHGQTSLNHTVLSPGDTINFLVVYGKNEWARFRTRLYSEAIIRTCYCSTLGDCWISTRDFRHPTRTGQPVGFCAKLPEADEFKS